ncbi:hypothetical protein F5X71_08490 [Nocardia brasiliensis]|uniref:Uncharacterized protein n=1 Tax=Nocardia brasiliensis TaxID=37326 RepID=A0A6G9XN60_NOCBR|nr:hypothetical protein [Nocardia brasiliensis]QIS02357.1 hypothetical protein F5X71_08490 [Nocardia brasiliensis]
MIVAAKAMVLRGRAEAVLTLLDDAESLIDGSVDYDEFSRRVDEVDEQDMIIEGAAQAGGFDVPSTPAKAVDLANSQVRAARKTLADAPLSASEVRARQRRCKELLAEIRTVRKSLL